MIKIYSPLSYMLGLLPDKKPERDAVSLSLDVFDNEFELITKNLRVAVQTITYTVARAVAYCAIDLLSKAQPRVPVDTGELRESGTVSFFFGWSGKSGYSVDIAKGNYDGTINANMNKISPDRLSRQKKIHRFDAIIHYFRENEEGEDIALWTHESLMPYEFRHRKIKGVFYAVTPDTGPKYLEIPWLQNMEEYKKIIETAAVKDSLRNIKNIS